jgi:hypothetical protein
MADFAFKKSYFTHYFTGIMLLIVFIFIKLAGQMKSDQQNVQSDWGF